MGINLTNVTCESKLEAYQRYGKLCLVLRSRFHMRFSLGHFLERLTIDELMAIVQHPGDEYVNTYPEVQIRGDVVSAGNVSAVTMHRYLDEICYTNLLIVRLIDFE